MLCTSGFVDDVLFSHNGYSDKIRQVEILTEFCSVIKTTASTDRESRDGAKSSAIDEYLVL